MTNTLKTLVGKYTPTPSTAAIAAAAGRNVIGLLLDQDWKRAMAQISERIATTEAKRAELSARRRELLLDAVEGGDGQATVTKLERELETLDRELDRLRDAKTLATERADIQAQADARAAHAAALEAWEAENEKLVALAERADTLAREAAETFGALADMAERQANACPGVGLEPNAADRLLGRGRAATACRWALAGAGAAWASPVGGVVPYPPPPGAAATIRDGLAWARRELGVAEDKAA